MKSPPPSSPPKAPEARTGRWLLWPVLIALAYGAACLFSYWQTPLGRFPVLDERENLDLAAQIAAGSLPAEPFYRAMGYPLLLALFPALGTPPDLLPLVATAFGLALHLVNTLLVARLALRLFASWRGSLFAGILHAIHPVLIFYALQIQDGVLAATLLLAGLFALIGPEAVTKPGPCRAALAGLAWALASLVRPQLLVLLPVLPLAWLWFHRERGRAPAALASLAAALLAPWLLLGAIQMRLHGEFRLLPTQGPYNLWAANHPGADGRYFIQTVPAPAGATHLNPTRHETLVLYARESGRPPREITLDEANAHWRSRLLAIDAGGWLRLLGRKTVYLLADYDAYNNKTYAFHKARSPWLRPNPLGWALVLALATLGFAALFARDRRAAAVWALAALALAAAVLLTFVSGRFRLPLLVLLCPLAGGVLAWRALPRHVLICSATVAGILGAISAANPLGARDERTFVQDHLLCASSAARAGDDLAAWNEAAAALRRSPRHPDALTWHLVSGLNRLLADSLSLSDEAAWRDSAHHLLRLPAPPPNALPAAGLALWRSDIQGGDEIALRLHEAWSVAEKSDDSPAAEESRAAKALALHFRLGAPIEAPALSADSGPFARLAAACASPGTDTDAKTLRLLARRVFAPQLELTLP